MSFSGQGEKKILIVGEAPGREEDVVGRQFVGDSGNYLRKVLANLGYRPDRDFYFCNVVNCRPIDNKGGNRTPTDKEIEYCFPKLKEVIFYLQPYLIISLGTTPLKVFCNKFLSSSNKKDITGVRGLSIISPEFDCWVMFTYHPSYLIRNRNNKVLEFLFEQDLQKIKNFTRKELIRRQSLRDSFIFSHSYEDVVGFMRSVLSRVKCKVALDWETTGLSPYEDENKIVSVGLCGGNSTVAFKVGEDEELDDLLVGLLMSPGIYLIAHNANFEDKWARWFLSRKGYSPDSFRGFDSDTQIKAHILYCRGKDKHEQEKGKSPGILNLEFQSLMYFGAVYKQEVDRRNIVSVSESKLLEYNAKDAYFTWLLDFVQDEELKSQKKLPARDLFLDSRKSLSKMSWAGIKIDEEEVKKEQKAKEEEIRNLESLLIEGQEGKKFKAKYRKELDLDSTRDLGNLFFRVLGYPSIKKTKKGNDSVDEEVLSVFAQEYKSDFCDKLLQLRKLKKLKSTYIDNLLLYVDKGGYIHPEYNLSFVESYRSSSDSPNVQNLPKRTQEGKEIRRFIVPSPGNVLLSVDYKGMEINVLAMYSKDPVLVKWLREGKDLHRYWAARVFQKSEKEVTKEERYLTKNRVVFPFFYGSWYEPVSRHLGMSPDFVKKIEREFWEVLSGVRRWQDELVKFYELNGFIEMFYGFKRYAPLSRNQIYNTPIQGTAFHILLESIIRIDEWLEEEEMESKMIAEIHDNLMFDTCPGEEESLVENVTRIMTNPTQDWAKIVPLKVEWEIGENWRDMEAVFDE
jgi:DNA polymerase-1